MAEVPPTVIGVDTDSAEELATATGVDTLLVEVYSIFIGVDAIFTGLSEDSLGRGRSTAFRIRIFEKSGRHLGFFRV